MNRSRLIALAVALYLAAALRGQAPQATLVLTNGIVHTMDPKRPQAEAVAVDRNRIIAVGTSAEIAKLTGPSATVLDLKGATVVPGLKESHGHFLGIGQQQMSVNLVGTTSYQQIIDKIAAAVRSAKPGEWVIGRGWHEGKWTDTSTLTVRGFPTHHALSAVSPHNPVYLTRADGHAGFANAKVMELMGIGKETKPPAGGDVIKDKDGIPTGIFVDRAQGLIKAPPPTAEQQRRALDLAMAECLRKGITAVDDAGVGLDTVALYKEVANAGKLNLRLYVMIRGLDNVRKLAKPEIGLAGGFLSFRAVKLSADGALGSRGAALLEPYVDDPGNSGFFTTPPEEVLETARFCLKNGFQLNVHAIGDRANRMVLDQFEKAFAELPNVRDPRFRDEHAQILDEQDIPRFAKLGVIASMQGIHATSDLPWASSRLGQARVDEGAYVWQKLLKSGVKIINGTDAPVEDVDPIKSYYATVTRQDERGRPPGGFSPDQKLSRLEALRSYTLDAAYGSFMEKDLGSIEAGKLADFTVLSKDILKIPDAEILKAAVLYTIVDGKVRYKNEAQVSMAAEAAPAPPRLRLEGSARPRKQMVELSIVPSQHSFTGITEIELDLAAPISLLWLNGRDLKVREASLSSGAETAAARVVPGGLEFVGFAFERPIGPGAARLRVSYEGVLNRDDTEGLFAQQEGGDWYVFTQFESTAARRAFPSFDEPSYKIPWTIKLRVPKDLVALSNAPEARSSAEGETKLVSFAETPPLPSYLVAMAVGPFDLVDAGKTGRQGAPIRIVTPRGRGRDARWAAETTATLVNRLEDYFDSPYPYAKLDQVTIPITVTFGAMENAGLVTYAQSVMLRKPEEENIGFRRGYVDTAAHELAHMWFGDLVTTAWWDDIWLNEAFASWMGTRIVDRWKPDWDLKVQRVFSKNGAMNQDSLATARKIRQPILSEHDIANAFDGITYSKGQAILEMFESWLGEEAFRKGVQQYLRKHAWGNATAADFLAALGSAAGRDVATPFSTFLDQSGVPAVSAELVCGAGKPRLLLTQKAYRPLGSKAADKTWQIPVCVESSATDGARQCTLLKQPSAELALDAASCPEFVRPNAQAGGYYRVAYRSDLLNRQLEDGGKRLSIPERVALIQDLTALVRSGDVKAADALAVVPVMLQDPSRHLVSATAGLVRAVTRGDVVPLSAQPKLAHFVREAYGERARALGWSAKPGEDEDVRLLRSSLIGLVAITGDDPALGKEAVALAKRWLDDPKAIDPDILGVALSAAARHGDRALFDAFLEAASKEKDRLRRQRMLGLLGSFRDSAIVKDALKVPLDPRFDMREATGVLFSAVAEPETRDLGWTFLKQSFDPIVNRMPREGRAYLAFAVASFCDAERRADAESFLTARLAEFPGGPRNLTQVLEGIDLCVAFKDAQQASVLSFLQKY